jgi:ATP synthase protein I
MPPSEPEDLRKLGDRLDAVERRVTGRDKAPPRTSLGIAFRFSTEMVAALIVGGGIGYGIDWLAGTKPIFLVVFFVLGAAAGIRNVLHAASEINAEMSVKSDGDTRP